MVGYGHRARRSGPATAPPARRAAVPGPRPAPGPAALGGPAFPLLAPAHAPAHAPAPIQRVPGDALLVNKDNVHIRKKRSRTAASWGKFNKGTLGVELDGRSQTWVPLRLLSLPQGDERRLLGVRGWVPVQDVDTETGTIGPKDDVSQAPDQYAVLNALLFTDDGPSSDDIGQGNLGDCWLLSPLGAMADTPAGKQWIRQMITREGTTRYRVRFFFHVGHGVFAERYATVSNRFPMSYEGVPEYAQQTTIEEEGSGAEGQKQARIRKGGIWPLVIEKAYADLKGGYFNLSGGTMYNAYAVITGRFPQGYSLAEEDRETALAKVDSGEELLPRLQSAQAEGKPVSVGIPKLTMKETLTFKRFEFADEVSYVAKPAREPIGRTGLTIRYRRGLGEVEKRAYQVDEKVLKVWDLGGQVGKLIQFEPEPGEDRQEIPVDVTYMTADLGYGADALLVAGHAYMLHEVDTEAETVTLINPHDTSQTVTLGLDQVQEFKLEFYVGNLGG